MSDIDKLWRKLLEGENQLILLNIIKKGVLSFFDHLKKMGYITKIPSDSPNYQLIQTAKDLAGISLHKKFLIRQIGDTPIIGFVGRIRSHGNTDYLLKRNKRDPDIMLLEKYEEFVRTADIIIKARHFAAHNPSPRNESGFALSIAASTFSLTELSPETIEERHKEKLKKLALKLITEVYDFEEYDEDIGEQKSDPKMQSKSMDSSIENTQIIQEGILERVDEVWDERHDQVMGLLLDVTNQNAYLRELLDSVHHVNEAEQEVSQEDLEEAERISRETAVGEIVYIEEDSHIGEAQIGIDEAQAERELLVLQRELKRRFWCENWENIAQGPFRERIFENKIITREDWLKNEFIKARYDTHSETMNQQLDSDIGRMYFDILKRIVWAKDES